MNILVSKQLYIFGWAIAFGAFIGLFYDFIRIFRRIIPHKKIAIGIEDLIFWLITGIMVYGYIFNTNDGKMRGFIFIGLSLGIILYYLLFSNLIVCKTTGMLKTFIKFIKKSLNIIFKPIVIIVKQIFIISKKFTKDLKKFKKWLIIKIRKFLKEINYIIKKI